MSGIHITQYIRWKIGRLLVVAANIWFSYSELALSIPINRAMLTYWGYQTTTKQPKQKDQLLCQYFLSFQTNARKVEFC